MAKALAIVHTADEQRAFFANWDDNERDDDPGHEHDNNDDETLSERCGTDVQLLWSPAKQKKSTIIHLHNVTKVSGGKRSKGFFSHCLGIRFRCFYPSILFSQDKSDNDASFGA